jgi:hydrogenase expression/formation protein HypE
MSDFIKLVHGDGGKQTHLLIENMFYKYYNNQLLKEGIDAAVFHVNDCKLAFTTDSFVVKPLFFKGGDIGSLAVNGTVNDLAVSGATPLYLSASFIIEEGFAIKKLESIVYSMSVACEKAKVKIVTGDTKVVECGSADGVFINTSGVGIIENDYKIKKIEANDSVIISGSIGEHGTAIALERYNINVRGNYRSDCAPLNKIIMSLKNYFPYIKIMKDTTRGGIGTVLNEISEHFGLGIHLFEDKLPIRNEVKAACEILGLDPLYLASEGRIILVVKSEVAKEVLTKIQTFENCSDAKIIGSVIENRYNTVYIENSFGGKRIINMLDSEMLPRIC